MRNQFLQLLHLKDAIFVNVKHFKGGSFSLTKHLPRYDVGVMLGYRNYYFIAFMDKCLAKRKSHKIYRSGSSGSEHNLFPGRRIEESFHRIPCALIFTRSFIGQAVNRPVDISIAGIYKFVPL